MTPFSDAAQLGAWLAVEVALAEAEAEAGVIPAGAAADIRSAAIADRFDLTALRAEAEPAGNLAIPLVRRLTTLVAERHAESAGYVHCGATSQDLLDTAVVLQLRDAVAIVAAALTRGVGSAAAIARRHARTPMAGRTWLQQASPVTLGLKAAGWLDMMARCRERVTRASDSAMVIQFGGASGTLAALGDAGPSVAEGLAKRLSLSMPEMPWHTQRDRLAEVACALGIACGALGKVGRDLTLLGQSEIGEVVESRSADRGGSSSMPHKQNPVRAVRGVAAATRAPGLVATMLSAMLQEHERAAGGWQAEWETLPALAAVTIDAADSIAAALGEMTVIETRIRNNLDANGGVALAEALSTALTRALGRTAAMAAVERVSRTALRDNRTLLDVAAEDREITQRLTRAAIARALNPEDFLGAAPIFVERVLRRWNV